MEQSEAFSKRFRESDLHRQGTIARWNLAYGSRPDSSPDSPEFGSDPRRPCSTWRPRRCFGTKRGVIETLSREQPSPAKHPRQVEPGLQQPRRFVAGFARIRFRFS
ncbi:DUF1589 domain-containing protein [Rhodopirellula sp. P2]|uniref:DUF1589 domain-containing protein n=1 Tax=Rhodopirellula sp. P2 TaxID=2127060 RepID=UPI003FD657CD